MDVNDSMFMDYELVRAAMEGWFPHEHWLHLNQIYAGLGQLLRNNKTRLVVLDRFKRYCSDPAHPEARQSDYERIRKLVDAYTSIGN